MTTAPEKTEKNLLDPGFELTLRPMRYPDFYERYRDAIKNTWTVEEVDLHSDVADLAKLTPGEQHMIGRLVAFFATGDSIVSNNLVLTLYKHINSPEARLYLSRQLFEEAVHVQFYLTLLDTYLPDPEDRTAAFAAVENIPSIREKAASLGQSVAENGPEVLFQEIENLLPESWREQITAFPLAAVILGVGVGIFLGLKKGDELIAAGGSMLSAAAIANVTSAMERVTGGAGNE